MEILVGHVRTRMYRTEHKDSTDVSEDKNSRQHNKNGTRHPLVRLHVKCQQSCNWADCPEASHSNSDLFQMFVSLEKMCNVVHVIHSKHPLPMQRHNVSTWKSKKKIRRKTQLFLTKKKGKFLDKMDNRNCSPFFNLHSIYN